MKLENLANSPSQSNTLPNNSSLTDPDWSILIAILARCIVRRPNFFPGNRRFLFVTDVLCSAATLALMNDAKTFFGSSLDFLELPNFFIARRASAVTDPQPLGCPPSPSPYSHSPAACATASDKRLSAICFSADSPSPPPSPSSNSSWSSNCPCGESPLSFGFLSCCALICLAYQSAVISKASPINSKSNRPGINTQSGALGRMFRRLLIAQSIAQLANFLSYSGSVRPVQ